MRKLLLLIFLSISILSCSDKEDKAISFINNNETVYCNDSIKIKLSKEGIYDISFDKNYINATKNNQNINIIGKHVGNTILTLKENGRTENCNITVKGKFNYYNEGLKLFGETRGLVKMKENREILSQDTTSIVYKGENLHVDLIMYSFKSNKLQSIGTSHNLSYSDRVIEQFLERYILLKKEGNDYYFISPDEKYIGLIKLNLSYVLVTVMPKNDVKPQQSIKTILQNESSKY